MPSELATATPIAHYVNNLETNTLRLCALVSTLAVEVGGHQVRIFTSNHPVKARRYHKVYGACLCALIACGRTSPTMPTVVAMAKDSPTTDECRMEKLYQILSPPFRARLTGHDSVHKEFIGTFFLQSLDPVLERYDLRDQAGMTTTIAIRIGNDQYDLNSEKRVAAVGIHLHDTLLESLLSQPKSSSQLRETHDIRFMNESGNGTYRCIFAVRDSDYIVAFDDTPGSSDVLLAHTNGGRQIKLDKFEYGELPKYLFSFDEKKIKRWHFLITNDPVEMLP